MIDQLQGKPFQVRMRLISCTDGRARLAGVTGRRPRVIVVWEGRTMVGAGLDAARIPAKRSLLPRSQRTFMRRRPAAVIEPNEYAFHSVACAYTF